MSPEELKKLGEKVADGSATPKEKLAFFQELNIAVQGLCEDLKKIKKSE